MTKYCGKDLLILQEDTPGGGVYTSAIAALRSTSVTINNEQVDVTDKGVMPWRELQECGVRSMSLSGSGIFTDDATHDNLVEDSLTDGQTIRNFKVVSGRGDSWTGAFQIVTLERQGEYNGAEEYSFSLESAGQITYAAAP